MNIRWLHISDIHDCNHERHFRKGMYSEIVKEVQRHSAPDLVFLTGDMAFAGGDSEYMTIETELIRPLKKLLYSGCPIFTVPGNHDVARNEMIEPRLWIVNPEKANAFQAIDANGARFRGQLLLPRFAAYAAFDRRVSAWGSNWLESEVGAAWWSSKLRGANIAVVGINTAWLSQDDRDWGTLTPGRYMLERALDEVRATNPDLLIILGHHPLDALSVEGAPGDGPRVRERLKQANAVYLHGHLHSSGSYKIGDTLRSTLTIQAPSAFQAHDDKRWRNGLMWGEIDLSTGQMMIEPRLWNEDMREYKFDLDAGYNEDRVNGRDAFLLHLPRRRTPLTTHSTPPLGWEVIDRSKISTIRSQPPTNERMTDFFSGLLPTWHLVLARGIQPRNIVQRISDRLRAAYAKAARPAVVLITGPGGEGKSTAILQTAAALIESEDQNWICLHRQSSAAKLTDDLLAQLPMIDKHTWIVVIDDADNVGAAIFAAVRGLGLRTDIHLLLAARDADWRLDGPAEATWQPFADFQVEYLTGLDRDDARHIIAGWAAWADQALRGRSAEDAATVLLDHAQSVSANTSEGKLLSAVLVTRHGDKLEVHVRAQLEVLGRRPIINKYSMLDIYVMIAAMHAENQLYLSREVLAIALECNVEELERKVLDTLRKEAMLDDSSSYLLTRHSRIAQATCAVVQEDGYDINRWYPFLAQAARRYFKYTEEPERDAAGWRSLARHFIEKGERWWPVAIAIAKSEYEEGLDQHTGLAHYSYILRHTRRANESFALLKDAIIRLHRDRIIVHEMGVVAATLGDEGLAMWLHGWTLSDGSELTSKNIQRPLMAIAAAFAKMLKRSNNEIFAVAQAASGQLGLRLQRTGMWSRRYFEKHAADGHRNGVADLSAEQAINAISKAVILGATEVDPANDRLYFQNVFGNPESYRYTSVLRIAGSAIK